MHARTNWTTLRDELLADPEARAGYEHARRAFELGEQVRQLRIERGLSQTDLARESGTSQAAIARLEAGGVEPAIRTLDRLSRPLGVQLVVRFEPAKR